jgi:hypothetical protein
MDDRQRHSRYVQSLHLGFYVCIHRREIYFALGRHADREEKKKYSQGENGRDYLDREG